MSKIDLGQSVSLTYSRNSNGVLDSGTKTLSVVNSMDVRVDQFRQILYVNTRELGPIPVLSGVNVFSTTANQAYDLLKAKILAAKDVSDLSK